MPDRNERSIIVIAQIIARQVFEFDMSREARLQIAVLTAEHGAAVGHDPRRNGRILIRSNVPVVGDPRVETRLVRRTIRGRQESGLAFVANGKGDVRKIENRYVLNSKHSIAGGTPV